MKNSEDRWHSLWLETTIVAVFLWPMLGFLLGLSVDCLVPNPSQLKQLDYAVSGATVGFTYGIWGGWLLGIVLSVTISFINPSRRWGSRSLVMATTQGMVIGAFALMVGIAIFLGIITGLTGRSGLSTFLQKTDALDIILMYVTPSLIVGGGIVRATWKSRSD